ncbi:hypothetical protein DUY81_13965 [Acidipropionibacterium acidipropionici]|uniref:Uncharacterized protein n=1 Tax=Acidipropionibacterium acidipropionici TaxID=1748 RepID=A0AAC8YH45_9ACTN|nr:hypothetical protein [Acidipropionibacterium acidipropionici]AMS06464.1 hypothetical protein AXH35_14400 [Acidipropionibacterium acidipropionici]AOZ47911.1 hypothetical protein A8L58_15855 [Acidipropionibacterium acidipropionici]AZP38743.1 hypothetical protein DUY81_13965 [Acidipropionibacterium acidipropionici]
MHILTNEGLRKAEQVEVQCILANLYNDLEETRRRADEIFPDFGVDSTFGYKCGINDAKGAILDILDAYDDPDFIHDMLDGQED